MSTAWAGGSTRAWRRVRETVLYRDGFRCRAHAEGWCTKANKATPHTCTGIAALTGPHAGHAHHTRGKTYGDDPAHIVAACATCNLHIGDPTRDHDPQPKPRTRW